MTYRNINNQIPMNVSLATEGNGELLSSASTGSSAITGYIITSNPAGGVDANDGQLLATHTMTILANGTPYTFKVKTTVTLGPVWSFTTSATTPLSLKIRSADCSQTWSNCDAFCSAQDTITLSGTACGSDGAYFSTGCGDTTNCGVWEGSGGSCDRGTSQPECTNWTVTCSNDLHGQTKSGDITIYDLKSNSVNAHWTVTCPGCASRDSDTLERNRRELYRPFIRCLIHAIPAFRPKGPPGSALLYPAGPHGIANVVQDIRKADYAGQCPSILHEQIILAGKNHLINRFVYGSLGID